MTDLQRYLERKKINNITETEYRFLDGQYLENVSQVVGHERPLKDYENEILNRLNYQLQGYCLIGKITMFEYQEYYILDVNVEFGGTVYLKFINTETFEEGGRRITWEHYERILHRHRVQDELENIKEELNIRIPNPETYNY